MKMGFLIKMVSVSRNWLTIKPGKSPANEKPIQHFSCRINVPSSISAVDTRHRRHVRIASASGNKSIQRRWRCMKIKWYRSEKKPLDQGVAGKARTVCYLFFSFICVFLIVIVYLYIPVPGVYFWNTFDQTFHYPKWHKEISKNLVLSIFVIHFP